ncbi:MAG: nucleotidyltransferase domain-containing protein [Candidatus Aminicenantes bacterium]|nr:nucleotidyltransferase domain-containing protein [Candidatus Aminicenantes bacterium]
MDEAGLFDILEQHSTLTGKKLRDLSGLDELTLWRLCRRSGRIILQTAGRRYLRLDRQVEGFARLSPSIKREFLTYTICGLKENRQAVADHALELERNTRKISREKEEFARRILEKIIASSPLRDAVLEGVCVIIAGDIVYDMAHLEPRPEPSTGRLVRGSDLDVIIVTADGFPEEIRSHLDKIIYREKYLCLIKPDIREEIDYIIKDLAKVRRQLEFDRFEHMVASKILDEGNLIGGNPDIFRCIQKMLDERGISKKIKTLTDEAGVNRLEAEATLLGREGKMSEEESFKLFYTKEEAEEIF